MGGSGNAKPTAAFSFDVFGRGRWVLLRVVSRAQFPSRLAPARLSPIFWFSDGRGKMGDTDKTETNGRRPDGTFGPGNRAAVGHRSRSAAMRKAFEAAITEDAITELLNPC